MQMNGLQTDHAAPSHHLTLEVVYVDNHVIELEAVVACRGWRGLARAYMAPENVIELAARLQEFVDGARDTVGLAAGAKSGRIALRFYRIDMAGHIACHVDLAADVPTVHRPEEISRLTMEVRAETWSVIQFARQLTKLGKSLSGQAKLALETGG